MPLKPVEELDRIAEPFEMLEMLDGQSIELRPVRWMLGKTLIHPRDGRPAHDIPVLRLWVPESDKPELPHYHDVTSKHLIAGLLGYLEATAQPRHIFQVTKRGKGPAARFTLAAIPAV